MLRRSFVTDDVVFAGDDVAIGALLGSEDSRDVRLGLDLLADAVSPGSALELRKVSRHPNPEVRVRALVRLAESGDARAVEDVAALVDDLARSADPADRRAAAAGLGCARRLRPRGSRRAPRRRRLDGARCGARRSDARTTRPSRRSVGVWSPRSSGLRTAGARSVRSSGWATRRSRSLRPRSPARERRGARLSCTQPRRPRRSTAWPSSSRHYAMPTA